MTARKWEMRFSVTGKAMVGDGVSSYVTSLRKEGCVITGLNSGEGRHLVVGKILLCLLIVLEMLKCYDH